MKPLRKVLFGKLEVNVKMIQSEDVDPPSPYFHLACDIKWLGLPLFNNFHSFYLTFHRSTKTIASLGYRTCPEYTIGYTNYISLWNQTDSKSYISVIGYSRGTKLCITRHIGQP